jgi:hypothetical protein
LRPGGDVFSTKHDITATLRVAEYGYGEWVWLFHQMGRGMNPWASIGIASKMYFINRIKLIPLLTESKTCLRLNFLDLDLHPRFRQFVGFLFLRDKYHRPASNLH